MSFLVEIVAEDSADSLIVTSDGEHWPSMRGYIIFFFLFVFFTVVIIARDDAFNIKYYV